MALTVTRFLLLCMCFSVGRAEHSLPVSNQTYQVLLEVQPCEEGLKINATPQLFSRQKFPVNGPFLSRHLEAVYSELSKGQGIEFFGVSFGVTMRSLDGLILDQREFAGQVGFPRQKGDEPGDGGPDDPFIELLTNLLKPLKDIVFIKPEQEEFLLDISYNMPFLTLEERKHFDPLRGIPLGIAYCRVNGNLCATHTNLQIRLFEQARSALGGALKGAANRDELIDGLRAFHDLVPSDRNVAGLLVDMFQESHSEETFSFVAANQPYFAPWYTKDPYNGMGRNAIRIIRNVTDLSEADLRKSDPNGLIRKQRKKIEKTWRDLPLSKTAWLKITTPLANDIVSGNTLVNFVVREIELPNRLLSAYCLVDDVVKVDLEGPPNRFHLNLSGAGQHQIKVVACFSNNTRVEDVIQVTTLPTDEQQQVKLSEVQLVALDHEDWPTTLDPNQLTIRKGKTDLRIERIRRDTQPLDLVILVDTSGSMKQLIYQVQFEVQQLLLQLKPSEAASVYTFDQKVSLVKRFENDMEETAPRLFTLMPQGDTVLYDALVVAHCKLLARQNSTKAIIILGDGVDTASTARAEEVVSLFEGSPVRVYAVQFGQDRDDYNRFLKELAQTSGGRYWFQKEKGDPQQALAWALASLRNLNFVAFHNPSQDTKGLSIKAPGVKLRELFIHRF